MKCNPSEDGVVLIPETDMESAAIKRWVTQSPWVRSCPDGQPGDSFAAHILFRPDDPPPPEPQPEPWTPKPGDRVRVKDSGRLARVAETAGGILYAVSYLMPNPPVVYRIDQVEPWTPTSTPKPSRTVRVPAPGEQVKVTMRPIGSPVWYANGKVASVIADPARVYLMVYLVGDNFRTSVELEDAEPIGDNTRWITVELPEEE